MSEAALSVLDNADISGEEERGKPGLNHLSRSGHQELTDMGLQWRLESGSIALPASELLISPYSALCKTPVSSQKKFIYIYN